MKINDRIFVELQEAINQRTSDSFEVKTSGNLDHFISSEGQSKGLYIGTIEHQGKEFKIYMI